MCKKLKKIIFVSIFFSIIINNLSAQYNVTKKSSDISKDSFVCNELVKFIDTINERHLSSSKYAEYVLFGYQFDSIADKFCFSIGYFCNLGEYNYIKASHFIKIKDNIILIKLTKDFKLDFFDHFNVKVITKEDEEYLKGRLIPMEKGAIIGQYESLICCINHNFCESVFYDNYDLLPVNAQFIEYPFMKFNKKK